MSLAELAERQRFRPWTNSPNSGVGGVLIENSGDPSSDLTLLSLPECAVVALDDAGVDEQLVDAVVPRGEVGVLGSLATSCPVAFATAALVTRATTRLDAPEGLFVESAAYSLLLTGPEFGEWLARNRSTEPKRGRHSSVVRVSRDDDQLRVVLDEPDRRNAYSRAMRDELREALTVAVVDESIERVIVTGSGTNFSSGGDLAEFGDAKSPIDAHLARTTDSVPRLLLTLAARIGSELEFRVHGSNVGAGVELAAFAGRVVAAPDSTFRLPEVSMGLIPGAGGTVSITRRIGLWRAVRMMLTGMTIDARTALEWGLVDEVREWRS
jgi:enoyl-CoA hydratase/carnithine racemase